MGDEGVEEVEPADLERPLQRPLDQPDQEDEPQPEDRLEEEGVGDEPGGEEPGTDRYPGRALEERGEDHPGDPVVGDGYKDQQPEAEDQAESARIERREELPAEDQDRREAQDHRKDRAGQGEESRPVVGDMPAEDTHQRHGQQEGDQCRDGEPESADQEELGPGPVCSPVDEEPEHDDERKRPRPGRRGEDIPGEPLDAYVGAGLHQAPPGAARGPGAEAGIFPPAISAVHPIIQTIISPGSPKTFR